MLCAVRLLLLRVLWTVAELLLAGLLYLVPVHPAARRAGSVSDDQPLSVADASGSSPATLLPR